MPKDNLNNNNDDLEKGDFFIANTLVVLIIGSMIGVVIGVITTL